ncbi:hypothetical protein PIB30_031901 [Stylosanthes scabra]|uniref:PHD-type domain-containing protein n=1 Tax=Stylosanthes scabra TaxID=79078 RepID=A0ABU6XBT3_9FABA|nr:hypothetical protein [Stylosanthes scabra]
MSKDTSSSDDDSVVFLGIVTPQDRERMRQTENSITGNTNGNVEGHASGAIRTLKGNNNSDGSNEGKGKGIPSGFEVFNGSTAESTTTVMEKKKEKEEEKERKRANNNNDDKNFLVGECSKARERKPRGRPRNKKKTNEQVLDEMMNLLLRAGWQIGPNYEEKEVVFYDLKRKAYDSIFSAYDTVKKNYEGGKGKGRFYLQDFKFEPLLARDINKLRLSSSWEDYTKDDKEEKKKKKRKSDNDNNKKKKQERSMETERGKETVVYDDDDSDSDSDEDDPNDDTCLLCANKQEGTLICCDSCPSSFHLTCLKLLEVPAGDWYCSYCRCKFCGLINTSTSTCDNSMTLTCCFCEHHRYCSEKNNGGIRINHSNDALSFCGNRCRELFVRVQRLLGVKHEIGDGFSCTFISGSLRVPHTQVAEFNDKLLRALEIMHDGFKPDFDPKTGINFIRNVIYGCGVHENKVAEMPLITTHRMYRQKGMCSHFLKAIESVLSSLRVDLLVIPSVKERENTWISVFGFEPFDWETEIRIEKMKLLLCPDSVMLKKNIVRQVPNNNSSVKPVPNNRGDGNVVSRNNNGEGEGAAEGDDGKKKEKRESKKGSPLYTLEMLMKIGKNKSTRR